MKYKIAVIGGAGFIGSSLVGLLLDQGHSVKILDIKKSQIYPEISVICDIRDIDALVKNLQGVEIIYNLAAVHRDDVSPRRLYHDVNVEGSRNICNVADKLGINRILFTSSVAVYGFTEKDTDESGELRPFNEYGKTKLLAEEVYRKWYERFPKKRSLIIIRPTVVFGEGNRGNVYNLLKQIASRRFLMIGNGRNRKSMAYVKNVASFLAYSLTFDKGIHIFNYADKPDYDMNSLVAFARKELGIDGEMPPRLPYFLGYSAGVLLDLVSRLLNRRFSISAIRIKKFCSSTQFHSSTIGKTGFQPPYSIEDGLRRTIRYEFLSPETTRRILFYTE